MSNQQQVAERLAQLRREKSARERRDVFREEIAEAVGLSDVTYGRYENGKRKVPEEAVLALAEYFGVTPAYIRYGIGETPIAKFMVPDDVGKALSQARQAKVAADPPEEPPAELPRARVAGERSRSRPAKRPKGRR